MDVFYALIQAGGEVVSREKLIDLNWETVHGADESLTRVISILRKTIRETGEDDVYVETISKRGYRLSQPIKSITKQVKISRLRALILNL